ncbi:uncharacterized protein N0V89_008797 [Didymosphaeria variabile]|uniref:Major facilitator superfamily (MFS) profile domain-containing protein n=1 Tax=Didymosphaeria variabile TaxID=1932322 RepID=A0A9W8XIV0_9PLEO|nr:uncharacterized protein N0V89_008797 [Didymosphaeria variabile]KAJ4350176.1 hypothetical protein N0V89_008797 [Didymosphaeria variabile]
MDALANPAVQLQDMPPGGRAEIIASEGPNVLEKTISRLSRRVSTQSGKSRHATAVPVREQTSSRTEQAGGGAEAEIAEEVDTEDVFPEGGLRAWLVVLGATSMLLPSFGLMVTIGTLQDYWHQNQLSNFTARDIGWIPSVFVYLTLSLSLWVGPLFDRYGPQWIALIGSCGYVVMVFLLAECTEFWQMILCLGVLGGVTAAMLTCTALAVVAQWFKTRRALAQGIAMAGTSVGGLSMPLILKSTFPRYGYAWSLRILGFMFVFFLVVSNILLKARFRPSAAAKKKAMISLHIFGDLRFSLFAITVFGFEIVLFGTLGILSTYSSISTHFPPDTSFYLIAVLNGVSCLGRIIPGYLGDKLGRFNTLLIMIIFTLVFMLALWLPLGTKSLPALYAFSALFGFGTGSWMALTPACIGQLCRADEFGRYYGSMYFVASLATLVCVPISGELVQTVGPDAMVGFFCCILALSLVSFIFSRWAYLGRRWTLLVKV